MLDTRKLVLLSLCAGFRLSAQAPGAVIGRVEGTGPSVLAGARVYLEGNDQPAVTDAGGMFRFVGVAAGRQLVRVRVLGYAPASMSLDVPGGDTVRVIFALAPIAHSLDTAVVREAEVPSALLAFEERRMHGPGVFFTREQLARIQPRMLTDVLRRVSSIQVRRVSGVYGENLVATSRGSRCPVSYYLNGTPLSVPADVSINHFIDAEAVVALEVYTPSEMPPQFNSSMSGARCGLVGIWTRNSR